METMHAAGRRRLPPVPRPAGDRATGQLTAERPQPTPADAPVPAGDVLAEAVAGPSDTELIDTRQIAAESIEAELAALTAQAERVARPAGDGPPQAARADETSERPTGEEGTDGDAAENAADTDTVDDDDATDTEDAADEDAARDETERFELPEVAAAAPSAPPVPAPARPAADESPAAQSEEQVEEPTAAVEEPADDPAEEPLADHALELAQVRGQVRSDEQDPAQQFVARLRTAAADFAGAAGAESAVVREAVPPARHRRARCRLVLRYEDGHVADVTFLGPAGAPGRPSRHGFDRQILRWLGAGPSPDDAWLVADPDAPDGVAVDLIAWVAAG